MTGISLLVRTQNHTVRAQNMPPQDTPLWHKGYFELQATEELRKCQNGSLPSSYLPRSRLNHLRQLRLFYQPRDGTQSDPHNKPSQFNPSLAFFFPIYLPCHRLLPFLPLSLPYKIRMYCSLFRCWILSSSSNHAV